MIKVKGLFAVSLIAILMAGGVAVNSAVAAIASKGYVDQQIDTRQVAGDYATNDALGTVRTTATNAQSAAAAAKTAADEAQDAADAAARAAATAQQTANAKVTANAAITAGTATKITYDAKGLVTGGASLTASDIPTISSDKVSGLSTVATSGSYNDLADKPSIPSAYVLKAATADALGGVKSGGNITVGSDGAVTVNQAARATTATTATTAASATKATQDASGNVITSTYATKTEVGSKLSSISGSTSGTGNVVTSVSASGSTVSATKGITAEETKNKVTTVRAASSATDTAYPSEKAVATALAGKANTSALSGYATKSEITDLNSSSTGDGAVVTGVSQSAGKVSVTKGNVKIPVGGENAKSYATIWIE